MVSSCRTGYCCDSGMENDFMKRGYLLPHGCKDLIDVLNLKQKQKLEQNLFIKPSKQLAQLPKGYQAMIKPPKPAALPPVKGEIVIPPVTTVSQLAALLAQKPFQIIADLLEMGVFANVSFLLEFET